jgi:hypothetical protein
MSGFVNVSHMTNRQIQRMGHSDDDGAPTYRKKVTTKKVVNYNYNADDVWGAAVAAQRINGAYVKLSITSECNPTINQKSNRQIVHGFLADPFTITDEDREQGKKVRAFFQAFTFKILQGRALSEFNNTAMLIANRDIISSDYDIAVICSLPSGYERGMKQQTVDQRINFARGGYIGATGNKVSTTIEVLKCLYSEKWGTNFITGINDEDQVVFFAYKNRLQVGNTVSIQGTVKSQRDPNTTQLNRVKVV